MTRSPEPKPGILSISPYVAGKSKPAGAAGRVIKLSSNENPLGPSPKALKAYADHAHLLHRYPDSAATTLRESIGLVQGLDPARIVCGAGSDELIGLLVHAYAGAGDEVLYSEYGFLMYRIYAQGNGAAPVVAKEKNLTADVDALLGCVSERTKIVFLANPNNPTGSYMPASEVARLRAGLPSHIILAIDGAYAEYGDRPDYTDGRELVDAGGNTVMLRTFSKIYGLSSLRLGWGYFPPAIADVINRLRGPFNVSGCAIAAGIAAMEDTAYTDACRAANRREREAMERALAKFGLTIHPSLANFLLVTFPQGKHSAAEANRFLMERGIIPREVAGYGLPDALRITIGTEEENQAVLQALGAFFP